LFAGLVALTFSHVIHMRDWPKRTVPVMLAGAAVPHHPVYDSGYMITALDERPHRSR
jgi:hypothetical protein